MEREVELLAPAKVNLQLRVLGRRREGYHEIVSLFQMVSLHDTLRLRLQPEGDSFALEGEPGIPPADNTVSKALELFRRVTGDRRGVAVTVSKQIPLGGGLGGGSSDAAAALWGLNRLLVAGLGPRKLKSLAAELGSDVPFFLGSATALVRGRGERVSPLPTRTGYWLALAYPGFQIRSAEAYGWLDEEGSGCEVWEQPREQGVAEMMVNAYLNDPIHRWRLHNSFSAVVLRRYPKLGELKNLLLEGGAQCAAVTGSGSTVCGLFADQARAEAAAERLAGAACWARVVQPLAKSPYP